jgi:hypothetical protein
MLARGQLPAQCRVRGGGGGGTDKLPRALAVCRRMQGHVSSSRSVHTRALTCTQAFADKAERACVCACKLVPRPPHQVQCLCETGRGTAWWHRMSKHGQAACKEPSAQADSMSRRVVTCSSLLKPGTGKPRCTPWTVSHSQGAHRTGSHERTCACACVCRARLALKQALPCASSNTPGGAPAPSLS